MPLIPIFSGEQLYFCHQGTTGIFLSEVPPRQLYCRGAGLSESVCAGAGCQVESVTSHHLLSHSNRADPSPRAAGAADFFHLSNTVCPMYGAGGML